MTDINEQYWRMLGVEPIYNEAVVYPGKKCGERCKKEGCTGCAQNYKDVKVSQINKILARGWVLAPKGWMYDLKNPLQVSPSTPTPTADQRERLEELIMSAVFSFKVTYIPRPCEYVYYSYKFSEESAELIDVVSKGKTRTLALMSLLIKLVEAGVLTADEVKECTNARRAEGE